eukprot:scaffold1493_cov17-Tisochrysis_lutea.AAC.1
MHPAAVTISSGNKSGPGATSGGQKGASRDASTSKNRSSAIRDTAGSASSGSASTVSTAGGVGRLVARNTSRRTLGRVLLYHNSLGQARVPPVGHQLSLKYCLMQEGVEVRVCIAGLRVHACAGAAVTPANCGQGAPALSKEQ